MLAPGAAAAAADRLEMGVRVAGGQRAAGTWSHGLAELADHLGAIDDVAELADAPAAWSPTCSAPTTCR